MRSGRWPPEPSGHRQLFDAAGHLSESHSGHKRFRASLSIGLAGLALIAGCTSPREPQSRVEFRPPHPTYRTAEQTGVVVLSLRARSSRVAIEQRILERADELERILHGLTEEELNDAARRRQLGQQIRQVFTGLGHEILATDLYFQPLPAAEPDEELLEMIQESHSGP